MAPQHSDIACPPHVSICTLTKNRPQFLPLLRKRIEAQSYPLEKIEWLILDDSDEHDHYTKPVSTSTITIKYQRIRRPMAPGAKRNLAHRLCSHDYIVYMDDDDYYFPNRVSHSVATLQNSGRLIAGATTLLIYFCADNEIWASGPFGQNHATAGTFALRKELLSTNQYDPAAACNEEKSFLNNYTTAMAQLDPMQTMICISHNRNTFDKRRMKQNGETPRMKKLDNQLNEHLIRTAGLQEYQQLSFKQVQ